MATSSITHNFFITDPAAAERFVNALEAAEEEKKHRVEREPVGYLVEDPKEISKFFAALETHWRKKRGKTNE